ncbi:Zinc finger CCCH domain-containing protein 48 [Senna tora]|uniref:Zinc finger CCCH domain-containing protein 48 n=1 Tax=Senna tora TaxID=362788 RepID=A0A834WCB9_9FABA|nr:Zinc finger CCCH domain-containing protein 48 [Senna tora]
MAEMDTKAKRKIEVCYGETCAYWLAGRCTRSHCKFLHKITPQASTTTPYRKYHSSASPQTSSLKSNSNRKDGTISTQKSSKSICKYWMNGNCLHAHQCWNLHSWFYGKGFSPLANLHQHKKTITGISLPNGTDKLFSCSTDGTVRIWNCHTGKCADMTNAGGQVKSLISAGSWVFAALPNAIRAWNIQALVDQTLDIPKGVLSMAAANNRLYAGAADGVIYVWNNTCDPKSPFQPFLALSGHTKSVVSLTLGVHNNLLFSASMDHTIKVWDLETLQCITTLKAHNDAVTSLICWGNYLISTSLDGTIKVWDATDGGKTFKVVYTHNEQHGIVALNGMVDLEGKPILFSSRKDNSVGIYELPSFSERGRLFSKHEIHTIQVAPGGLFFTGDNAGLLKVWNLAKPELKTTSS